MRSSDAQSHAVAFVVSVPGGRVAEGGEVIVRGLACVRCRHSETGSVRAMRDLGDSLDAEAGMGVPGSCTDKTVMHG
jgi:hypothetical protein